MGVSYWRLVVMLKPVQNTLMELLRLGLLETAWIQQVRFKVRPEYANFDTWTVYIRSVW